MGRTVLSAATDDAPALEGYRGHGVFSYVVLEALSLGDSNGDGLIDITELASYVDQKVPEVSYEAFKLRQVPQMKIIGSNYSLLSRLAASPVSSELFIPTKVTHVVFSATKVLTSGRRDAAVADELIPGTQLTLLESASGWALVARGGKKIGYVEENALMRLQ